MKTYTTKELLAHDYALTFDDISLVPCKSDIKSRNDVNISTEIISGHSLFTPILPSNMDTITESEMMKVANDFGSIGFLHRFMDFSFFKKNVHDYLHHQQYFEHSDAKYLGVSIGLDMNEYKKWVEYSISQFKNWHIPIIVMIDIANGYSSQIEDTIKSLQKIRDEKCSQLYIIAGNVADYDGAKFLCDLNVDGIRAGIGGGSVCETRIRTGVGVPNITSLLDCRKAIDEYQSPEKGVFYVDVGNVDPNIKNIKKPTLICDGGIKTPGDIAKALAVGADMCLCGYLFAGSMETPGEIVKTGEFPRYVYRKIYRGSASQDMKKKLGKEGFIEGNSTVVSIGQSASVIFNEISDGLKSAFSYLGARNVEEFRKNARFILTTPAGIYESKPNALYR